MNRAGILWRWFASRTVREAMEAHRHVRRLFRSQCDLLEPEAAAEVAEALENLRHHWTSPAATLETRAAMAQLRDAADRHLEDPSRVPIREATEMLAVALIVVMAVRTFGIQPMEIPTGSMQPTLFGVTAEDLRGRQDIRFPTGLRAWLDRWGRGRRYYHVVAASEGKLERIEPPEPVTRWLPFLKKQRFQVGDSWYTIWFPPADLPNMFNVQPEHVFFVHARIRPDQVFRKGEDIIKLMVSAGDHVLVDRFTYNFRRPRRGEILVFETTGIVGLQQGTHYIKRLVGLPGERVRIGDDRHVLINDVRLDATTRHFESVYSFAGPARDSVYSGHMNDTVAVWHRQPPGALAPFFRRQTNEFKVHPRQYLVLGDNTVNSHDGRKWGDFPQEKVIGRFLAVYWPWSRRFGWAPE